MNESNDKTITHPYWVEALFNYATIGIVVTNNNGSIINFNKQAENDFGYAKEEVIGKPVEILIPPALETKHKQYRYVYYEHPSPRAMGSGRDLFAKRKDGTVFPVEVSLSNYTINNDLFVIAFVIDITIRKQHELQLFNQKEKLEHVTAEIKKMNAELEKKVEDRTKMLRETLSALEQSKHQLSDALKTEKDLGELKSRFVSMASHEFKTPLSTILSSSYLLDKYNDVSEPEKRSKHISRIKNAVNDMKLILDDFLSLDRLDAGVIKSAMAGVKAPEFFKEIEAIISEMKVNCKPEQTINYNHTGNKDVIIDKHLLKSILINLLSNAIKFSPENSIINIECLITENELSIAIKDNGIGISEEDKQHLFQRFFRAKNAFNIEGTGLGLNIVAKYLELMNGNIKIESSLNKGSVFTITVPQ